MILFGSELIKVGTEYTPLVSAANEARRLCLKLKTVMNERSDDQRFETNQARCVLMFNCPQCG